MLIIRMLMLLNIILITGHKRNWDLMHRYAFFMLFLEDGTKATIGVICQPCTCSRYKCVWLSQETLVLTALLLLFHFSGFSFYNWDENEIYRINNRMLLNVHFIKFLSVKEVYLWKKWFAFPLFQKKEGKFHEVEFLISASICCAYNVTFMNS